MNPNKIISCVEKQKKKTIKYIRYSKSRQVNRGIHHRKQDLKKRMSVASASYSHLVNNDRWPNITFLFFLSVQKMLIPLISD